jgi:hypothetical protein
MSGTVAEPSTAPTLPIFYHSLEALTAERHGGLRLRDAGFGFAAKATAVPLTAEEFSMAARSLPIVFGAQPPHMPVVVTGLGPERNLFVTPDGHWRKGAYVPAYLRRVPFFLVRAAEQPEDLVLCADPGAAQLSATEGEPIFTAEGKPTPILTRALDFTRAVEEAVRRTQVMAERLTELGLLKPAVVQFEHAGKPLRVDGFHAVDRPALAALPPEQLAELRDKGWLEPIFAHLVSMAGIAELAQAAPA